MALTQGFWVSASSFCFLGQCLNGLSLLSIASSLPTECQTEWGDEVILHLHQSWQFCNALIWICYKGRSLKVRSVTVGTRAGLNSLQLCVPNTRVTRDSTEYNTKIPKRTFFSAACKGGSHGGWNRGGFPWGKRVCIFLPSLPVGYLCPRISRQRVTGPAKCHQREQSCQVCKGSRGQGSWGTLQRQSDVPGW